MSDARSARDRSGDAARVLLLPDLFASELHSGGKKIWPSVEAVRKGGLGALRPAGGAAAGGDPIQVGELVLTGDDDPGPKRLHKALGRDVEVAAVPYDWRGGVTSAARALKASVREHLDRGSEPVHVLAHGLGALGALCLVADDGGEWHELKERGGRLVLAAPPLMGAEAVLAFAIGKGRLFRMLEWLDRERSATEILNVFSAMRGVLDLLPQRVLTMAWWERSAAEPYPAAATLLAVERERSRLRAACEDPAIHLVFGAAEGTPYVDLDEDDEPRLDLRGKGDGWNLRPELPAHWEARVWFVAVPHERLWRDPAAVGLIADLLRSGAAEAVLQEPPKKSPSRRSRELTEPRTGDLVAELVAADLEIGEPVTLRVRVAHGSLDQLPDFPLAVGHFAGDSISYAEAFLDRCLDGRLSRRHRLTDYPGPLGTASYVNAPECSPSGALVVGLGEVGELTASVLSQGVSRALLQWAMWEVDRRHDVGQEKGDPSKLSFSSLLIGTRSGGQLSVRQCMVAITRGALLARRELELAKLDDEVTIHEVTFVELWADIAIAAGHAARDLEREAGLGLLANEHIEADGRLIELDGARGNSRYKDSWSWWRRLIVTEETRRGGATPVLRFVTLTERARAEDRHLLAHSGLVDELLERAPTAMSEIDGSVINALYELLLPVGIKDGIFDGADLVLVVNREAGRYPWELLARRQGDDLEPLVERIKVVRQFRTSSFRQKIVPARGRHALVVGDPLLTAPGREDAETLEHLEGAEKEAREVTSALESRGFAVEAAIRESGGEILQKLFLRDYRILHIAAHGVYDESEEGRIGVVVGTGNDGRLSVLGAEVFEQLRAVPEVVFLNCCHLAGLEPRRTESMRALLDDGDLSRLAASVAEALINLGVRCVVAAGWAVRDDAARIFAGRFYEALLGGEPFGEAVHAARQAVLSQDRFREITTWGAYQCYGDPTFQLREPAKEEGPEVPHFVSPREVQEEIANVIARAASLGTSSREHERLSRQLEGLEEALKSEPIWRRGGALLFELAEAWAGLGKIEKAVPLYRRALSAEDAQAPLRAAERIANFLSRYPDKAEATGDSATKLLPLERNVDGYVERVDAWLSWLDRLGATPERLALKGALLKRRVAGSRGASEKGGLTQGQRSLLEGALRAYREGAKIVEAERGRVPYYQGLNAVALGWILAENLEDLDREGLSAQVEACRGSAREEMEERGENLFNACAKIEADLLQALIDGRELKARAEELGGRFRRVLDRLGRGTERDSVIAQIEFLRDCCGRRWSKRESLEALLSKVGDQRSTASTKEKE